MAVLLTLLLCAVPASSAAMGQSEKYAEPSTQEMWALLLERDYPAAYLDTLVPPQLAGLYKLAREKDAHFYALAESGESGVRGRISAERLALSLVLSYTPVEYEGDIYFSEGYLTVHYCWREPPVVRGSDSISVSWDPELWQYGGDGDFTAQDLFRHPASSRWEVYETWEQPQSITRGGVKISTDLGSGAYLDGGLMWSYSTGLAGTVQISLLPEEMLSIQAAPGQMTGVGAVYIHGKTPLGLGLGWFPRESAAVECDVPYRRAE